MHRKKGLSLKYFFYQTPSELITFIDSVDNEQMPLIESVPLFLDDENDFINE